jgi:hypothetical protein
VVPTVNDGVSVLVRTASPATAPPDHLVLQPGLVSTFDGDRRRHSVHLAGSDRRDRFDQFELDRLRQVLRSAGGSDDVEAIWLCERGRLLSSWSRGTVGRLERTCQAAAIDLGVVFVAWTGDGGDDGSTRGYDLVIG